MMLEPSPNFMEAAFMNCSSLDDTTPVDERGVKWPMKLYGGAQIDVFTMMLGTYYTPCARLEDAFYGTKGGYRLDLRLLSYGYSAEEL